MNIIKNQMMEKGEYGYIDRLKKQKLILSAGSFIIVLIIFLTGIIIYHTNKSIFAVIAALSALPAAKLLTMYIAIYPYSTGDKDIYKTLEGFASKNSEYKAIIGADFILTSSEKSMSVQFAYIINGKLICYTDHKKTDIHATEAYIRKIFDEAQCQYTMIRMFNNKEKFYKQVEAVCMDTGKEYTDKRIFEKLCAYSI